jgi:coenzyme F420-reducing hydrogenase gamma subunit
MLLGLTIWALKVIMDVRSGCGGCAANINNLGEKQKGLEKRQDLMDATVGDLALSVGNIEQRVHVLEDK